MPAIEIRREHGKSLKDARAAVERVAGKISERFDVSTRWEGDTLHFQRSGVDGHIAVSDADVQVRVNLSFFLMALRGTVEQEIHKQIDREFA